MVMSYYETIPADFWPAAPEDCFWSAPVKAPTPNGVCQQTRTTFSSYFREDKHEHERLFGQKFLGIISSS